MSSRPPRPSSAEQTHARSAAHPRGSELKSSAHLQGQRHTKLCILAESQQRMSAENLHCCSSSRRCPGIPGDAVTLVTNTSSFSRAPGIALVRSPWRSLRRIDLRSALPVLMRRTNRLGRVTHGKAAYGGWFLHTFHGEIAVRGPPFSPSAVGNGLTRPWASQGDDVYESGFQTAYWHTVRHLHCQRLRNRLDLG